MGDIGGVELPEAKCVGKDARRQTAPPAKSIWGRTKGLLLCNSCRTFPEGLEASDDADLPCLDGLVCGGDKHADSSVKSASEVTAEMSLVIRDEAEDLRVAVTEDYLEEVLLARTHVASGDLAEEAAIDSQEHSSLGTVEEERETDCLPVRELTETGLQEMMGVGSDEEDTCEIPARELYEEEEKMACGMHSGKVDDLLTRERLLKEEGIDDFLAEEVIDKGEKHGVVVEGEEMDKGEKDGMDLVLEGEAISDLLTQEMSDETLAQAKALVEDFKIGTEETASEEREVIAQVVGQVEVDLVLEQEAMDKGEKDGVVLEGEAMDKEEKHGVVLEEEAMDKGEKDSFVTEGEAMEKGEKDGVMLEEEAMDKEVKHSVMLEEAMDKGEKDGVVTEVEAMDKGEKHSFVLEEEAIDKGEKDGVVTEGEAMDQGEEDEIDLVVEGQAMDQGEEDEIDLFFEGQAIDDWLAQDLSDEMLARTKDVFEDCEARRGEARSEDGNVAGQDEVEESFAAASRRERDDHVDAAQISAHVALRTIRQIRAELSDLHREMLSDLMHEASRLESSEAVHETVTSRRILDAIHTLQSSASETEVGDVDVATRDAASEESPRAAGTKHALWRGDREVAPAAVAAEEADAPPAGRGTDRRAAGVGVEPRPSRELVQEVAEEVAAEEADAPAAGRGTGRQAAGVGVEPRPSRELVQEVAEEVIDPLLVAVVGRLERDLPERDSGVDLSTLSSTLSSVGLVMSPSNSNDVVPNASANSGLVDVTPTPSCTGLTTSGLLDLATTPSSVGLVMSPSDPNDVVPNASANSGLVDVTPTPSCTGLTTSGLLDLATTPSSVGLVMSPSDSNDVVPNASANSGLVDVTPTPSCTGLTTSGLLDLATTPSFVGLASSSRHSGVDLSTLATTPSLMCLTTPFSVGLQTSPSQFNEVLPNASATSDLGDLAVTPSFVGLASFPLNSGVDDVASTACLATVLSSCPSDSDVLVGSECSTAGAGVEAGTPGPVLEASKSAEWPDQGKEQHRTARKNKERNRKRNRRARK